MNKFSTFAVAFALISPAFGIQAQVGQDSKVEVGNPQTSLLLPAKGGLAASLMRAPQKVTDEVFNPPFFCNFSSEEDVDLFSTIDANRDNNTWGYNAQGFMAAMYNSWQPLNDYLVSPGLNLKKDFIYTFTVNARPYQSAYPEKLELWAGTAPTQEGLSECLLPTTTLTEEAWLPQTADFIPEVDGVYYFAVRAVSDADQYALLVNDFSVSEGVNGLVPARPTFEVLRNPDGELSATINVTTPTLNAAGSELSSLSSIRVYRDGELIKEIDGVEMDKTYTIDDVVDDANDYTYTAECTNEAGTGLMATEKVFIGIYIAVWPEKVTPTVGENEGQVKLEWSPCLVDQKGNPLRPDQVTYTIYRIHNGNVGILADGITEPSYIDQVCEPEDFQRDVQYTVMSNTSYGQSAGTGSGIFYAGAPYTLPYTESVPNGELTSLMFSRGLAQYAASWDIAKIGDYDLPYPTDGSDNDGGFLYHRAYNIGEKAMIGTAKVHIPEDAESATLYYDTFLNDVNKHNDNTLEVIVIDDGEQITIATESQHGPQGWAPFTADLTEYAGKTIQVAWINSIYTHVVTAIDNIKIDYSTSTVGVDEIAGTEAEAPRYYNLQGVEITSPKAGQIVIVRKGEKTTREIFRK